MAKFQNQNRRPKANVSKLRHKCPTGKIRFRDHEMCVAALHKSANIRALDITERGFTKRNEIRSYPCEKCAGWHVSSKATWDSRLEAA
jgi:hypothetical protein